MHDMSLKLVKEVLIRTIPVMTGYLVLGIGFGVLLEKAGYSFLWALLMSATIFSGTLQYVAVDILSGGASIISTAIMTVLINARYLFYSIANIDRYKGSGWKKPYLIFGLTDETYALIISGKAPKDTDQHLYNFLITLFDQIYWIIGSVIGTLAGAAMDFNTKGIEFIMTALFVAIFVDQWKENRNHLSAISGVVLTVACLAVFGPDKFLIPAMISITIALAVMRRWIEK
jgi:4-azaleucine resistance transporter AzlC